MIRIYFSGVKNLITKYLRKNIMYSTDDHNHFTIPYFTSFCLLFCILNEDTLIIHVISMPTPNSINVRSTFNKFLKEHTVHYQYFMCYLSI